MVKIGILGVGFMGMVHYLSYQKIGGAQVVALCDANAARLQGDWRDIQGNFGPRGTQMDLSGIATYQEIDQLLQDPQIDLVDICLPPAAHADTAVAALEHGKHVFCEKPMAMKISDTQRMIAASETSQRQLMIGHVLPMFPEYDYAIKAIQSGNYGKLLGGHFRRVINDPSWVSNFYHPEIVGGPMLDLHIHDAHFIRLVFGKPKTVTTSGRMRGDVAEYFHSQFEFDDPNVTVLATSGVVDQQARSFLHGYEIHMESATLLFEFAVIDNEPRVLMPCTILPKTGKSQLAPLQGTGDPMEAFLAELTHMVEGIQSSRPADFLNPALAQDALLLCHKQTDSLRKRRPVKI